MLTRSGKRLKTLEDHRKQTHRHGPVNNELGVNFKCLINRRFPVDPVQVVSHQAEKETDVVVEDEKVYERAAIRKWVADNMLKDPFSKVVKTPNLVALRLPVRYVPVPSVARTIQDWIDEGRFEGDEAAQWIDGRKILMDIKNGDDASAAKQYDIGIMFFYGHPLGYLAMDKQEAYRWFEKSFRMGSVMARAMVGYCKIHGIGTVRDHLTGLSLLHTAADGGSDFAAYRLSILYSSGTGVFKDKDSEVMYLRMTVKNNSNSPHRHLDRESLRNTKKRIKEMPQDDHDST